MQFIVDTIEFVKTLALVDVMFFFAVLALMLILITLIYFIKENSEEDIYIPENPKKEEPIPISTQSEIDSLKEITQALEEAEPSNINLNKYEEEQEEKAIISYEELLTRKNDFAINYSEEENIAEDLTVKKVDLSNLLNKDVEVKPKLNVSVISYDKEEAFLEALKALQQKLN